jgi:hypothetical protein
MSDLVTVLSQPQSEDTDGYLTAQELLARMPEYYKQKLLGKLHELDREGRLEYAMVRRVNLVGRVQWIPGYRIKK